jgi:hypothetical protein
MKHRGMAMAPYVPKIALSGIDLFIVNEFYI